MNDIELVKSKIDIAELLGSYFELKRAGANYKARCPFHNEKTASFMVSPTLQIYKCFGCGKSGDIFKFIQDYERVEFPEALRMLAQKAGVELTHTEYKNPKKEEEKKRIIEANTLTAKFYNYILTSHKSGKEGLEYAKKRMIDAKRVKDFLVGFAPVGNYNLKNFLIKKGFTEQELISFGLLVEKDKDVIDKFRNRLMQPIFDLKGNIVGFSGRYIGDFKGAPKYLNSPETIVYKKNELLYGLFQAKDFIREHKYLILVEGNIDILSSHRVGVGNIAAPLGTAFTVQQARLLKRFTDEVYFCFDSDDAGTKALIRSVGILEQVGLNHKVIDLGDFQDADDLIKKDEKLWPKKLAEARDSLEYLIEKLSNDLDLGSANGKRTFKSRIMPIISLISDEVMAIHYAKKVSMILEVPEETILDQLKNVKQKNYNNEKTEPEEEIVEEFYERELPKYEIYLLALILRQYKDEYAKMEAEVFTDSDLYSIFKLYLELKDVSKLLEKLQPPKQQILKEILLTDTEAVKDFKSEISKTYSSLLKEHLNQKVRHIKRELIINEDDLDLIYQLNEVTKEIKRLDKQ